MTYNKEEVNLRNHLGSPPFGLVGFVLPIYCHFSVLLCANCPVLSLSRSWLFWIVHSSLSTVYARGSRYLFISI